MLSKHLLHYDQNRHVRYFLDVFFNFNSEMQPQHNLENKHQWLLNFIISEEHATVAQVQEGIIRSVNSIEIVARHCSVVHKV